MGAAGGATVETEETRIKDRMLKNIIYYWSLMIENVQIWLKWAMEK
jgi:hypothetical protein